MPQRNSKITAAKNTKNDEFYTRLGDIERELCYYEHHFKNKIVYCNCDDPRVSNFFRYFLNNFHRLGLKKLMTMCYKNQDTDMFNTKIPEKAISLSYTGHKINGRIPSVDEIGLHEISGDGDFSSKSSIELLKEADIVVTNPPFSLFRKYITQLIEYDKKFLIIGNINAITYKEWFSYIRDNKIWLGITACNNMSFITPDGNKSVLISWFTNLDHTKRNEFLVLSKHYIPSAYPFYDNYDAIEVSKVVDIPNDYTGTIGVPITFMAKYNPEQFEILGATESEGSGLSNGIWKSESNVKQALISGRRIYKRIFIRNKTPFVLKSINNI